MAIHDLTGQRVALKCIRKATVNAQNSKAKTRVAREIDYLKMVNHPHIIKMYVPALATVVSRLMGLMELVAY